MAASLIAVGLVVGGTLTTLLTKLADESSGIGYDGTYRAFSHPFVQALAMFCGEMLCLAWPRQRRAGATATTAAASGSILLSGATGPVLLPPPAWLFAFPAFMDLAGTSLLNIALGMTSVAAVAMLRGSVVVFVAILSRFVLGRRLKRYQILGVCLVMLGTVVVGYASAKKEDDDDDGGDSRDAMLGNVLVVIAVSFSAVQAVFEENVLTRFGVDPLLAVGLEGCWGTVFTFSLLGLILSRLESPGSPEWRIESVNDALTQMCNSPAILWATLGFGFAISLYNFCGITIVKEFSATHRMVLDTMRTITIWMVSLIVGWEEGFDIIQFLGFCILVSGGAIFNKIIVLPDSMNE